MCCFGELTFSCCSSASRRFNLAIACTSRNTEERRGSLGYANTDLTHIDTHPYTYMYTHTHTHTPQTATNTCVYTHRP